MKRPELRSVIFAVVCAVSVATLTVVAPVHAASVTCASHTFTDAESSFLQAGNPNGVSSDCVAEVQKAACARPYDGVYGQVSVKIVADYGTSSGGYPGNGIVGPKTFAYLVSHPRVCISGSTPSSGGTSAWLYQQVGTPSPVIGDGRNIDLSKGQVTITRSDGVAFWCSNDVGEPSCRSPKKDTIHFTRGNGNTWATVSYSGTVGGKCSGTTESDRVDSCAISIPSASTSNGTTATTRSGNGGTCDTHDPNHCNSNVAAGGDSGSSRCKGNCEAESKASTYCKSTGRYVIDRTLDCADDLLATAIDWLNAGFGGVVKAVGAVPKVIGCIFWALWRDGC